MTVSALSVVVFVAVLMFCVCEYYNCRLNQLKQEIRRLKRTQHIRMKPMTLYNEERAGMRVPVVRKENSNESACSV